MKNPHNILIALALLVIFFSISLIKVFDIDPFRIEVYTPSNIAHFSGVKIYRILTNNANNSPKDFSVVFEGTDLVDLDEDTTLKMKEADYVRLLNLLNQTNWGDTLTDWNLFSSEFYTSCSDDISGFYRGEYIFFKPIWKNGSLYYIARGFLIQPSLGVATVGGDTIFPHPVFGWGYVDTDKLHLNMTDGIKYVDNNGGKAFRDSTNNECKIVAGITEDSYLWIRYRAYNYENGEFEKILNPYKKQD